MQETLNEEIFKGKTFSDLLKDIYKNVKKKDDQIQVIVDELKNFITSTGDAVVLVPIVQDFVDTSIKNNDQLVKMAGIVQKTLQPQKSSGAGNGEGGLNLSKEEIDELKRDYEESQKVIAHATDENITDLIQGNISVKDLGNQIVQNTKENK